MIKKEGDRSMNEAACKHCYFYHAPDIEPTEPVCNFPWFDYTPEDVLRKACASEDDYDGELEY